MWLRLATCLLYTSLCQPFLAAATKKRNGYLGHPGYGTQRPKPSPDERNSENRHPFSHCGTCYGGICSPDTVSDPVSYTHLDVYKRQRIGGSGDTDVIVRWKDEEGKSIIAIVDGKSKSGGSVSHSDVSDVAIDTHKEKNNADYVAIVGPGFSGDTIRNHARKKGFALITDAELIEIARMLSLIHI